MLQEDGTKTEEQCKRYAQVMLKNISYMETLIDDLKLTYQLANVELKKTSVAIFFSTHIISDIEKCADDIVYISGGNIVAATSKADFVTRFSMSGENLEQTFLRLERGAVNE